MPNISTNLAKIEELTECLSDMERTYENFFEKSADGFLILTIKGSILYCNSALCSVLGYSKKDLLGNPHSAFIFLEDITKTKNILQEAKENNSSAFFENRWTHKDNQSISLSWSVSAPCCNKIFAVARVVK